MKKSEEMRKPSTLSIHGERDETINRATNESIHAPTRSGNLYCKGFFRWVRFHAELSNHTLYITLLKGGIVKKTFHLRANTVCEDNSTRPFCFQLRTPNTKEVLILAAENIANKEIWMESIQTSLSLLRLADRKLREKDKVKFHEEAVKQYITRPIIYFKVIRARNLTSKDNNGFSDPYVKIILGSSSVRTTTRKKNLNPDWGMVFSFDWEINMRYAIVEVWDEDYSSSDDFLGVVYIPVFSFYDGYNSKAWYPLGKRSFKSSVSGEIEIEISCSGQPDADLFAWQFFYEVQRLPEFSINLVAQEDGSGQIGLRNVFRRESVGDTVSRSSFDSETRPSLDMQVAEYVTTGFPLFFPSIEMETLEDISLSCEMLMTVQGKKVPTEGVLLLTSMRLIFVTTKRILSERNTEKDRDTLTSTNTGEIKVTVEDSRDLSTQIFLPSIALVQLVSENDFNDPNISYDVLKIKTFDCRNFLFLFKDDGLSAIVPHAGNLIGKAIDHLFGNANDIAIKRRPTNTGIEASVLSTSPLGTMSPFYDGGDMFGSAKISAENRRKISILQSYSHSADSSAAFLAQYGNLSALEVAWLNMVRGPLAQSIEATDAPEGPPCHRMTKRIKNKVLFASVLSLSYS